MHIHGGSSRWCCNPRLPAAVHPGYHHRDFNQVLDQPAFASEMETSFPFRVMRDFAKSMNVSEIGDLHFLRHGCRAAKHA
jgi:hypothetical protein